MKTLVLLQRDTAPRPLGSAAELRDQFSEPKASEWESGRSAISVKRGERTMHIYRNERGFLVLLRFGPKTNPVGDALLAPEPRAEGSVTLWSIEMTFPAACFVDGGRAFSAVEHFVATGEKAPEFDWLSGDLIDTGEPA